MAQPNLLDLARQGDLNAIGYLINRALQSQNIKAKLRRQENCLKILLEGAEVPPQSIANSLQTGLQKLDISSIDRLEIYGKQSSSNAIAWTKTAPLAPAPSTSSRFPAVPDNISETSETPAAKACPRPYFALSLLTTFLAFLPLGIAALFFSRKVEPLYEQQDYEGAKSASETAKILCIVGICFASPFYVAIGFLATSYSIFTSAQAKQTDALYELQAKTTIEAINQGQQAYWLENSRFAASADQLQLELQPIDRYQYEFIPTESDRAIVTAAPTKPGLKRFTGIVYTMPTDPEFQPNAFVKTNPLQSAICATSHPIAPAEILVEGDRIICPADHKF